MEHILNRPPPLTAREVYQVLKDAALGVRTLRRMDPPACDEPGSGVVYVDIDGWQLTFHVGHETVERCDSCTSDDGRSALQEDWQRFGTNPVDLLSQWEHEQLYRQLTA